MHFLSFVKLTETELDRLVNEGLFEPLAHSDWAAPIVPVIKPDGSIRSCGDYKQTINRASDCDKYPIPRTEDLFDSLGGSEKFTNHVYTCMRNLQIIYIQIMYKSRNLQVLHISNWF